MLALKEVSLKFSGREILNQVSLEICSGECMVLWGLNGAGKSSLLDILSGWRVPDSGNIFLEEKLLSQWKSLERASRVAYLAQYHEIYFDASVLELLENKNNVLKLKFEQLLNIFNLNNSDLLTRRLGSLSGGEKAKIALLRALLQLEISLEESLERFYEGRYLLLDEPLAHLDMAYQKDLYRYLMGFKQQGLGLIMIIHDLNQAWKYADRFLILANGKLWECETPEEILRVCESEHGLKLKYVPLAQGVEGEGFFI